MLYPVAETPSETRTWDKEPFDRWDQDLANRWIDSLSRTLSEDATEELQMIVKRKTKFEKLRSLLSNNTLKEIEVYLENNDVGTAQDQQLVLNSVREQRLQFFGMQYRQQQQLDAFNQVLEAAALPSVIGLIETTEKMGAKIVQEERSYVAQKKQKLSDGAAEFESSLMGMVKMIDDLEQRLTLDSETKARMVDMLQEAPRIFICGNTNVGKSSLVNTLLRETGVVISEDRPCTSMVTSLKYAPTKVDEKVQLIVADTGEVIAERNAVSSEKIAELTTKAHTIPSETPVHQEKQASLEDDMDLLEFDTEGGEEDPGTPAQEEEPRKPSKEVVISLHKPLLKYITLVDTPGLLDEKEFTDRVNELSKTADMILFMVDSLVGLGREIKEIISQLSPEQKDRVLYVCNKFDLVENPEAKQSYLKDEILQLHPNVQDEQLHFLTVKQAYKAYTTDFCAMPKLFQHFEEVYFQYLQKTLKKRGHKAMQELQRYVANLQTYLHTAERATEMEGKGSEKETLLNTLALHKGQIEADLKEWRNTCSMRTLQVSKELEHDLLIFWKKSRRKIVATQSKIKDQLKKFKQKKVEVKLNQLQMELQEHKALHRINQRMTKLSALEEEFSSSKIARAAAGAGLVLGTAGILGGAAGALAIASGGGTVAAAMVAGVFLAPAGLLAGGISAIGVAAYRKKLNRWMTSMMQPSKIKEKVADFLEPIEAWTESVQDTVLSRLMQVDISVRQVVNNLRTKEEFEEQYGAISSHLQKIGVKCGAIAVQLQEDSQSKSKSA